MNINSKPKLAISALLLSTVLLGCGDNKTTTEYMAEAKTAISGGQKSVAIINLKNVLKTEADNAEARFLLGSVYVQQGLWVNAEKELSRAEAAGFSDDKLSLLLLKVNYRLENIDYLASIDEENKLNELAKLYLAISALKDRDIAEGRAMLDEIILVNNNQDISKLAMAWESLLVNENEASLAFLNAIESSDIIHEDIIELRVANFVAQKNYEAAAEQLELFLSLYPQSHIHRLQLADQYAKYRNYPKAEENADLLLTLFENNVVLNRIKAEIKFNAKEYSLAKEFADIALRNSNDVLSKIIAGLSAYQLEQYEASYNYLSGLSNLFDKDHPVNQMLTLLSNQLAYGDAGADNTLPDMVTSLIQSGDYNKTRELIEAASNSSILKGGVIDFRLGLLKIIEGDDSFTEDFERAIAGGYDGIEPAILLAQQYLQEKEYDKVLEIAESLSSSNEITALLLEGSVYLEQGNLAKAIEIYQEALTKEPENTGVMFKLSQVYFKKGDSDKSIALLKNIYSISSSNLYAVKGLFKFSLDDKNKKSLEQFFITQLEVDKKRLNRHIVLAEFYLLHNEFEQALDITTRYLIMSPEQLEVTLLKTRALLSLNRITEAEESLNTIKEFAFDNPDFVKNKALILNAAGKKSEAIAIIEKFQGANNTINDELLLLLSGLYIESVKITQAENTLNKVNNKQSPRYIRIAGKVALINGNNLLAKELLSKAYNYSPEQVVALELAQVLQNLNELDAAIQLLESYIVKYKNRNLILVNNKLAELSESKYPLKAERYYKQLLEDTSNSPVSLNNIAWFYYTQQRFTEAKKHATEAVKKAPKLAPAQNTLGVILLALEEFTQASFHLKASVELEKSNNKYKVWLAKSYMLNNDAEAAKSLRWSINVDRLEPEMKLMFDNVYSN